MYKKQSCNGLNPKIQRSTNITGWPRKSWIYGKAHEKTLTCQHMSFILFAQFAWDPFGGPRAFIDELQSSFTHFISYISSGDLVILFLGLGWEGSWVVGGVLRLKVDRSYIDRSNVD